MSATAAQRIAALSPRQRDELLRRLRATARPSEAAPALAPDPARRFEPFPLTEIQQIYLAGQSGLFELGACGGNVYLEYELEVAGDRLAASLERAVARLAERHDILRAVVLPDGRQRILPEVPPCPVEVVDLRGRPPAEVEAALATVRQRLRYGTTPLDRWPLFEFLVHRLEDGRSLLHGRLSALLADGTSRQVLIGDLLRYLAGGEPLAPPPAVSYRDYAVARAALGDHPLVRRCRDYWLDRLDTLPPAPELPLARPLAPETPSQFVVRYGDLLPPAEWSRLKARAVGCGSTPSLVVLCAYADVLARWAAEPRFTLALEATDYFPSHPGLLDVVGNFNTVHLLAVEEPGGGFADRLLRLQERMAADLEHRFFSGLAVMRELRRRRGCRGRALFPIFFNSVIEYSHPAYLGRMGGAAGGDLAGREVEATLYLPQVLLLLTVNETLAGGLGCKCQSVDAALAEGLVPDLLAALRAHLRDLAASEESWRRPLPSAAAAATGHAPPPAAPAGPPAAAPSGELELRLADLWAELLGRSPASLDDDFFALGGDSFSLVLLLDRLRRSCGREIPGSAFLDDPTLARLAALVRGAPSVPTATDTSKDPQGDRR